MITDLGPADDVTTSPGDDSLDWIGFWVRNPVKVYQRHTVVKQEDLKTHPVVDHNTDVGFLFVMISLWPCEGENVILWV